MTATTLPLKKFLGQIGRLPTLFVGIPIVAPMILLLTVHLTRCIYYHLIHDPWFSYNFLGFLPYIEGRVSIAGCAKKSRHSVNKLLEADLDEAEKTFGVTRDYLKFLVLNKIEEYDLHSFFERVI
jgi:hypothetical protein